MCLRVTIIMSKRKILILGGTGYFGKHLVNMLLAQSDQVCIVTRGNNPIPKGCSFVKFDRSNGSNLYLNHDWDVVYDQSCYSSGSLSGLKNIITHCGNYVLTSSQSVYPPGMAINENSVNYESIHTYKNAINDYGIEKLNSESIINNLTQSCVFPRFPVVVGFNDPRKRIQALVDSILAGSISLPVANPQLQLLDELDAAKILFEIPYKNITGPINISSPDIISAEKLCLMIAKRLNVNLQIHWTPHFKTTPFDLIKSESKTLLIEKQEALKFCLKDINTIIENIMIGTNS